MSQSPSETRVSLRDGKMVNDLADIACNLCLVAINLNARRWGCIETKNHTTTADRQTGR
jgi:hypothetical protein